MAKYIDVDRIMFRIRYVSSDGLNNDVRKIAFSDEIARMPAADVAEVRHAYWTGRLTSDNAFAEGYAPWFTEEDKRKHDDWEKHKTHCSNCKGSFDDRRIRDWKYCPYCGAKMDGKKEEKRAVPRCRKCVCEMCCSRNKDNDNTCPDYKRDPPDGGYYG